MIQVMDHHIRRQMRSGRPGTDLLPLAGAVYDATTVSPEFKSTSTRPHREVPFLRDVSVSETLLFMKNKGVHPVKVRARDMPNGREWDNFDVCAHTFHTKYCSLEGLSRTSDMAQAVLQYIFHGFFEWRTKSSPAKVERRKMKSFFSFFIRNWWEEGHGSPINVKQISPSLSNCTERTKTSGDSSSRTVVKVHHQWSTTSRLRKVFGTTHPRFMHLVLVL